MSECTLPPHRHAYADKRLARAYQLFIDGAGSLREVADRTKVGYRTLCRHSSNAEWVAERDTRASAKAQSDATTRLLAAAEAAMAVEGDLQRQLTANPDQKTLILAVLKRHQKFWDRVELQVSEVLSEAEREAAAKSRTIPLGKLIPILKAAEIAAAGVRKAYGIPDVSKIEWEDTTSVAKMHAEAIRQRRMKRLSEQTAAAGREGVN